MSCSFKAQKRYCDIYLLSYGAMMLWCYGAYGANHPKHSKQTICISCIHHASSNKTVSNVEPMLEPMLKHRANVETSSQCRTSSQCLFSGVSACCRSIHIVSVTFYALVPVFHKTINELTKQCQNYLSGVCL